MIRVYDNKTVGRLFLSPFVRVWHNEEKTMFFESSVFQIIMCMPFSASDDIGSMLDILTADGMTEDELKLWLHRLYPDLSDSVSVIQMLMKAGIVE